MSNHTDLVQRLQDYSQGARLLDKKAAVPEYPGWCREASDLFAEAAASLRDAQEVIEKVRGLANEPTIGAIEGRNPESALAPFKSRLLRLLPPVTADEPKPAPKCGKCGRPFHALAWKMVKDGDTCSNLAVRFRGWLCETFGGHHWARFYTYAPECRRCGKFRFMSGYGDER